jgi:hypothetical protein
VIGCGPAKDVERTQAFSLCARGGGGRRVLLTFGSFEGDGECPT